MKSSWVCLPIPRFGDYSVSSFHGYWHPICFSEGDSSFQISSLSNILAMVTMKKKQSLPCMQDKQICSSSTKGSGPTLSPRDFWKSLEGECKSLLVTCQCEKREPLHPQQLIKELNSQAFPITYSLIRKFHFHVLPFFYPSLPASWNIS